MKTFVILFSLQVTMLHMLNTNYVNNCRYYKTYIKNSPSHCRTTLRDARRIMSAFIVSRYLFI